MLLRRLLLLLVLLLPLPAAAAMLKVATWNMEWLTLRPAGSTSLPPDVRPKRPQDIARLRAYADVLNADVVAMEEVDGPAIAAKVFTPDRYALHFTHDHVVQRVGIAIRRGIPFTANPDVTGLDPYPPDAPEQLRSGADVTLHLGGTDLRILAVHLKSGCWETSLHNRYRRACAVLREQLPVLERWIGALRRAGMPFLVLGDFNRVLLPHGAFLAGLERAAKLSVATAGYRNPCWGGRYSTFIDQILAGGAARTWMEHDSLRVLVYRETAPIWRERLSDHCPVAIDLKLPR
ncbi:MAG: endonuclease/exonuclease/phosphatase family protein [Acetobacteraceae bacterium]